MKHGSARRAPEARGLLRRPARAAARAVARQRLERALERAAPFIAPVGEDTAATIGNEEVHDFRVSLRRLRSWIRGVDGLLDTLPRRERSALRRFARRAGAARDAQVEWQWLTAPHEPFSAPAARAARWLAEARRRDYAAARDDLQQRTAERWPALAAALAEALAPSGDTPPAAIGAAPTKTLGAFLAPVMAAHVVAAAAALDRIEHRDQVKVIHRARIEVKRLRYLVEAVEDASANTREARALRHLRALQDALGELHDAHVIMEQLAPWLVPRRGRKRPAGRPALRDLRALRAAVRRRELAAFRRAMDLLAAPSAPAAWHALEHLPARIARLAPGTVRRTRGA